MCGSKSSHWQATMFKRNNLIVVTLILVFICAGFFREFVFLNWNEQMRVTYYHSPDLHVHSSMQWLSGYSYETLYWLKWPMTLFFSAIFAGLTVMIVHILFRNKSYNRIALYGYAAIFLCSFLFFGLGWLLGFRDAAFPIARGFAGLIETPALLIILMASFLIHRRL
jgi:hypothetical protein